ncbi:hypothetical protein LTR10_017317 [Elasticomyces elasticus]|uniref:Protection of telomeres protein 1 n=1 Tax=Exophiala sideris TaxID=1016849 RepID=A0ABR0JHQ0_9EURO|nr:hypothetical protein LTR10_017317 [Elasticomyces elasticus]KAK5034122.1 hypothetical protein LTS07_003042 [Exophiala sideris]KAK5042418.1 hypothetical protein LTR13_001265 [Exophiala sideris]KAK5065500.1 hypothetical protein LTR69_003049 [Exophiala sideris]KAK5186042.1 hypothetical protein LTR44_002091 [Eurotiomycetes sp. CCFEE 6388]
MDPAPIPPNFISLNEAVSKVGTGPAFKCYNVIGVCVDYLEPTKSSRGRGDHMITFTLHDPWWMLQGQGMKFRFFNANEHRLPAIHDQGDIVILRNVKTMNNNGQLVGVSNYDTNWVVLPYAELDALHTSADIETKALWQGKSDLAYAKNYVQTPLPNDAVLKYVKYIAEHEDPSRWSRLAGTTRIQLENIIRSSGGQPPPREKKFRLVEQLSLPSYTQRIWVEMLAEVRKIYTSDSRMEMEVTDYTSHFDLYDHQYDNGQSGRDGDEFGYLDYTNTSKSWPGPWGKMALSVVLWEPHCSEAKKSVNEGTFVYLRNLEIRRDKNGLKLEGHCRTDTFNSTSINFEVRKPKEDDEELKALLLRKRNYEAQAKAENKHFFRHPQDANKRKVKEVEEVDDTHRSKKAKGRNRRKKENKTAAAAQQVGSAKGTEDKALKPNVNVRCNNFDVPIKPIIDILDGDILERKTPKGNPYRLPFQNCKYKSNVRVVDFFPDNIEDFAVPRVTSEYDVLGDSVDDHEDDIWIDLTQKNAENVQWEWRFFLLVEDARLPPNPGGRPTQMELLVADTDGDFLLKMDACDLRDKKNATVLAQVKEKLFHLWGDLQERKEESATVEALEAKPSARPFECLIKEYGVPVRKPDQSKDSCSYDRMFRLCWTTI